MIHVFVYTTHYSVCSNNLTDEKSGDLLVFEGMMMKRTVHQIRALHEYDKPETKK